MNEKLPDAKISVLEGPPLPFTGAILMALISAIVVGFSFVVIKHWPQPASVAPSLDLLSGAWWGIIVGGITGFILGFLTDDKHFSE